MSAGATTTRIIGRYAIYQPIAAGGMATVYLGRLLGPVGFARTVAIKCLHPQYASESKFVSMFLDEARLAARIRHPNVVPTLDVVAMDGELFLVMEYVHGESLGRLLRAAAEHEMPIPVPIVVATMSGALQGLQAAHEAKSERGAPLQIIHRDVSPQNILLGRDGQARILDFGVARAQERLHTTQEGLVKGKMAYMAPEQLRGEQIGPYTDIYAAAIVMWEALTGRGLFRGKGAGGLVVEVLEGKADPPSVVLRAAGDRARADAVAPLDDIVMRGLARAPADRFQTARELARALEATVVAATAAQVSDWVEGAAGTILRERASMVAEIENASAVDLTQGDLGAVMAQRADPAARNEWPAAKGMAAKPSTVPPPEVNEAESDAPAPFTREMTTSPLPNLAPRVRDTADLVPPTTTDPQPTTLPLVTTKDSKPPVHEEPASAPPAAEVAPRASRPPAVGPSALLGTLVSAKSPLAEVRSVAPLMRTLQSAESPVRLAKPGVVAPPIEPPPPPSVVPTEPAQAPGKPPRGKLRLAVGAVVVLGVVGASVGGYYLEYGQGPLPSRRAKPVDTTGLTTHSVPRTGFESAEPPEKPTEK